MLKSWILEVTPVEGGEQKVHITPEERERLGRSSDS